MMNRNNGGWQSTERVPGPQVGRRLGKLKDCQQALWGACWARGCTVDRGGDTGSGIVRCAL